MVQPTALNFVIVSLMVVIFTFMMRLVSGYVIGQNPDSEFGKALGAVSP